MSLAPEIAFALDFADPQRGHQERGHQAERAEWLVGGLEPVWEHVDGWDPARGAVP